MFEDGVESNHFNSRRRRKKEGACNCNSVSIVCLFALVLFGSTERKTSRVLRCGVTFSPTPGLNRRPSHYKCDALPLS